MTKHDPRLEEALELILRIAEGEAGARAELSDERDVMDAVLAGLNMLADEMEAERAQRTRAEELLRDALDAYEDAPGLFCSVATDDNWKILKLNATFASVLGMAKDELIGRPLGELCSEGSRAELTRVLTATQLGQAAAPAELELVTHDGSLLSTTLDASVARDSAGVPVRVRLALRDVTKERQLEKQLYQAQKLELVGRFAGGIAHDFNNILSVILSCAELAMSNTPPSSQQWTDLTEIRRAAERAATLVSRLLTFSRRQIVRPRTVDLNDLVREAESMLSRVLGDDVTLEVSTRSDAPSVRIDPTQLSQVLLNLATNARDAMPDGGVLKIETARARLGPEDIGAEESRAGEFAVLSVADSGVGMTEDVKRHLFEPFFTTKPVGQGTGLGLSMCYGAVRQAGGLIKVTSSRGSGARFEIFLPAASNVTGTLAAKPMSIGPGSSGTVLLVEDEPFVRSVTARILNDAGYHVLVADGPEAALRYEAEFEDPIDVLVTDVVMPGMNGRELATELRNRRNNLQVLYISGYPSAAFDAPGDPSTAFLAKPYVPSALLGAISGLRAQRASV